MDMEQHMSTDPLDLVLFIQYNLRKKLHSDSWLIGSLMLVLQEMRTYKNLVSPPTYVPRSCATNHAAAGGAERTKRNEKKRKGQWSYYNRKAEAHSTHLEFFHKRREQRYLLPISSTGTREVWRLSREIKQWLQSRVCEDLFNHHCLCSNVQRKVSCCSICPVASHIVNLEWLY